MTWLTFIPPRGGVASSPSSRRCGVNRRLGIVTSCRLCWPCVGLYPNPSFRGLYVWAGSGPVESMSLRSGPENVIRDWTRFAQYGFDVPIEYLP